MMLDEHFSEEAAAAVRRALPGIEVQSIHETQLVGLPDPPLLEILDAEGLVLVTRDVNSIPGHLASRLASGLTHGGVIFVDSKRLRQTDFKGFLRRLAEFVRQHKEDDWQCRTDWLWWAAAPRRPARTQRIRRPRVAPASRG